MAGSLILVANPGSASRKYALFENEQERASLHFEWEYGKVVCTLHRNGEQHVIHNNLQDIRQASGEIIAMLRQNGVLQENEHIEKVGLRIVAPSAYFLEDRIIDDTFVARLESSRPRAPLHIAATLDELYILRSQFSGVAITGVSDSAFHATKPDYAWNYGISLEDADRFEIKRFGYHGLSVASIVHELSHAGVLPPKLIVCHLGSGASVTAVRNGQSIDTTMGYSPLEGVIMSTRSGSIDHSAVHALKEACRFDDNALEDYLNNHSGLLGLGGSSDVRELLRRERNNDQKARLALATYIYSVQKAIGQMAAVLNGADMLVFTGTIGERSADVRTRIAAGLGYLNFAVTGQAGKTEASQGKIIPLNPTQSRPVLAISTQESAEIVRHIVR